MKEKKCTKCGKIKSTSEFHTMVNGKKCSWCRKCRHDDSRNRLFNKKIQSSIDVDKIISEFCEDEELRDMIIGFSK